MTSQQLDSLLVLLLQDIQDLILLERQLVLRVLGFIVIERLGDRDIRHIGLGFIYVFSFLASVRGMEDEMR
jgi:hypothetical protein